MLSEFRKLVKDYIDVYWDIKNETEALTAEQRNIMQAELLKQFNRDCAKLEGLDGLAAERERAEHENELKQIEEIKKLKNAKTDAEYRLKHAELTKNSELEVAKIQQKIDLKKAKLEAEKIMLEELQQKEIDIRKSVVVPIKEHHKRWWQRRWRPNEAYKIADKKAQLDSLKYLEDRKNEVAKLQAELTGSEELEIAVCSVFNEYINTKRGRKKRAAATALTEIVKPLCAVFARREHELEGLIDGLSKLRETKDVEKIEGSESTKIISTDDKAANVSQESPAEKDEWQRLQKRAASLIIALCERRITETQQEQFKKPPRKRVRKKPDKTENISERENDTK